MILSNYMISIQDEETGGHDIIGSVKSVILNKNEYPTVILEIIDKDIIDKLMAGQTLRNITMEVDI